MNTLPPCSCPTLADDRLEPREAGRYMQTLGPAIDAAFAGRGDPGRLGAQPDARARCCWPAPRHEAVYDFGGFDPRLNQMRYDAPGAPELATRVAALLQAAGIPVHLGSEGGLDHGIWTPLRYLYPGADIPVLPLAWPPHWKPAQLYALGQALAPLADEACSSSAAAASRTTCAASSPAGCARTTTRHPPRKHGLS